MSYLQIENGIGSEEKNRQFSECLFLTFFIFHLRSTRYTDSLEQEKA